MVEMKKLQEKEGRVNKKRKFDIVLENGNVCQFVITFLLKNPENLFS